MSRASVGRPSALLALVVFMHFGSTGRAELVVVSAAGPDAASIQETVDAFRSGLGTLNPNNPVSFGSGRREINWDAAPDAVSAPNAFPGDFFNASMSPRARGIEFTTPGTGLQLSATEASGAGISFANIDPSYADAFASFSPERLFTATGSNIVDVEFFLPGTTTSARAAGFGAVFSDVDLEGQTTIQLIGDSGSLGIFDVPAAPGDGGFSFLGIRDDSGAPIRSVRITSGNAALSAGVVDNPGGGTDLVVMDDFIFGEAVPEPSALWLCGLAAACPALGALWRRMRRG